MLERNSAMHIAQSEEYQGDDWWNWAVWIKGSRDELDAIKSVTYTLHSTFRNPVRKVTDRGTNFRLKTEGWGVFTLYARVDPKSGDTRRLKHDLQLHYPDGSKNLA
jgi:transcription initiation factor IIF auxiliary subunit